MLAILAKIVKDYQTLLASIIALSAALIAYRSAQRVALSSRDTAMQLVETAHSQSKEDRNLQERRLRLAILLELRSDLDAFRRLHAFRVRFSEMLGAGPHVGDTQIPFTRYQLAFASLELTIGRLDNLLIVRIATDQMSMLDMQTQRNIHFFAFALRQSEEDLKDLSIDLKNREYKFVLGVEVSNFVTAVQASTRAEEHVRHFLDARLQEIGSELESWSAAPKPLLDLWERSELKD